MDTHIQRQASSCDTNSFQHLASSLSQIQDSVSVFPQNGLNKNTHPWTLHVDVPMQIHKSPNHDGYDCNFGNGFPGKDRVSFQNPKKGFGYFVGIYIVVAWMFHYYGIFYNIHIMQLQCEYQLTINVYNINIIHLSTCHGHVPTLWILSIRRWTRRCSRAPPIGGLSEKQGRHQVNESSIKSHAHVCWYIIL